LYIGDPLNVKKIPNGTSLFEKLLRNLSVLNMPPQIPKSKFAELTGCAGPVSRNNEEQFLGKADGWWMMGEGRQIITTERKEKDILMQILRLFVFWGKGATRRRTGRASVDRS
jgi:hypothetical protein